MAKCVSSGQLHFVDCLTQLVPRNSAVRDLKSSEDTSASLKSYSLDPRSAEQYNLTCECAYREFRKQSKLKLAQTDAPIVQTGH